MEMTHGTPIPTAAASTAATEFAGLVASLATVPDVRKPQGKLHPLPAVLALVVLGLMSECRSLSAIRRFGRSHPEIVPALGLRSVPSVPTLSRVLAGVAPAAVREALRGFARSVTAARDASVAVVAMDGKALRGVHEGTGPTHLLHLFTQESAVVLDQVTVGAIKDEVRAAERWITTLAATFPGLRVLTADALYADRDLCAAIVAQEYAYLIRLKKPARAADRHRRPVRRQRGGRNGCRHGDDRRQGAWPTGATHDPGLERVGRLQRHARLGAGRGGAG